MDDFTLTTSATTFLMSCPECHVGHMCELVPTVGDCFFIGFYDSKTNIIYDKQGLELHAVVCDHCGFIKSFFDPKRFKK